VACQLTDVGADVGISDITARVTKQSM